MISTIAALPFIWTSRASSVSIDGSTQVRFRLFSQLIVFLLPCRMYLIQFFDEWQDFRKGELLALLEMFGVNVLPYKTEYEHSDLFLYVDLPSDSIAQQICGRSIVIKAIYEVWGTGASLDEAAEVTRSAYSKGMIKEAGKYTGVDISWCLDVQLIYKKVTSNLKGAFRERFRFLNFQGPVKLKEPDVNITVLLDYSKYKDKPYESESPDVSTYCGRLVCMGGMRTALRKYDIKKRLYIGPTTLDHALAFIMANMAGAQRGNLCLDPFVGTASLLVALAHHGAFCFGSDIDVRVIRGMMYAGQHRVQDSNKAKAAAEKEGRQVSRDVFSTFSDYGLPPPQLLRLDLHSHNKHFHTTSHGMFDSIVTDPPYGIRAGGRKTGKSTAVSYEVSEARRHDHIPSTQSYGVEEVMLDLLECSADLLKVGGKLCYLIPTPYNFQVTDLPRHPCLKLDQLCLQTLSTRHGRHAVLMKKVQDPTPATRQEFAAYKERVFDGKEDFASLCGKLEEALAPNARQNEEVVIRSSKCADKRRAAATRRQEERKKKGMPSVFDK
jgi:tRNA (guanine10-N2)-methyltransferase